jgi:imidazolonepropionase-like amidohydrolase
MIAITNAKIITMANKTIENGDIIIKDSKIYKIGKNLNLSEMENIIDATDKIVLPGFVDAHTHIGIGEEDIGWAGRDFDENTDPVTPHLRALDAINPQDTGFDDARRGGITTAMVTPGSSNVFGGICTVIKTQGNILEDMILKEEAGLKAALGENPKRDYGVKQNKAPKTRMGIAAIMREEFYKAIDYRNKKNQSIKGGNYFSKDMKYEEIL